MHERKKASMQNSETKQNETTNLKITQPNPTYIHTCYMPDWAIGVHFVTNIIDGGASGR